MLTSSSSLHTAFWPLVLLCISRWPTALLFTLQFDLLFCTLYFGLQLISAHCMASSMLYCCPTQTFTAQILNFYNFVLVMYRTHPPLQTLSSEGTLTSLFLARPFMHSYRNMVQFLSTHATQTSIFRLFPSFCLLMQSLCFGLYKYLYSLFCSYNF